MYKPKVLHLSLATFSLTGGIEKVNRVCLKALVDLQTERHFGEVRGYCLHDLKTVHVDLKGATIPPESYISAAQFKGFGKNRLQFMLQSIWACLTSDIIVISHINLAPMLLLGKFLNPKAKFILYAHGIEIWCQLGKIKKLALLKADKVLAVSNFTKHQIELKHYIGKGKIEVLNNCLDPFLPKITDYNKQDYLLERYGLSNEHFILYTLTRLSSTEQYKGYDQVLAVMEKLKNSYPNLRYLIGGKADLNELQRVKQLIINYGLEGLVILAGFIKEEEFAHHFTLADVYIMPSTQEGFGITFIEAANYGMPLIGGNLDGSSDAMLNGVLGKLINPNSFDEIRNTIQDSLINNKGKDSVLKENQRDLTQTKFTFKHYKAYLLRALTVNF
jgi:glycosyltransferase involved in cell wall biosynthesis